MHQVKYNENPYHIAQNKMAISVKCGEITRNPLTEKRKLDTINIDTSGNVSSNVSGTPAHRRKEPLMTIKDIAKLAGVSISTVSRVLNNHPDVSEENRQYVLSVIRDHNYIPNNSARSLVKTTSDSIGLIVRGISNPFYTDIIRTIEERITSRGYTMVMQQISSNEDEIKFGAMMERDKRLQGIVFLGGRSDYSPKELQLLNVPFVCCSYSSHYGTVPRSAYSSVSIADEEEAYRAVMELYRAGHRRIAALISRKDDQSISQLRYQGYLRALQDCGLPFEEDLIICANAFSVQAAYAAIGRKLRQGVKFTAIFSISDTMAIGAMRALREANLSIPEDCSIIAIDGLEISDYIHPQLTTLCQPMQELGKRSVDILLDLILNQGLNRQEILPTTFRSGASVRNI